MLKRPPPPCKWGSGDDLRDKENRPSGIRGKGLKDKGLRDETQGKP